MNQNVFVFTEIFNCAKIGRVALQSFLKHHPECEVHVYGFANDFAELSMDHPMLVKHVDERFVHAFRQGHFGTACFWADLIQNSKSKYLIHFDSDAIFRDECMTDIVQRLFSGADLVGPIRNYKHNPNNRDDVRHLADLTQTFLFGFNREKIKQYPIEAFIRMCQGAYNPYGHPVIDFFDPVMFDIVYNGGKVDILDQENYGSCDYYGKRDVGKWAEQNRWMDFGNKVVHFSAVGSGMNFFRNKHAIVNVPQGYIDYAVERYALFCKIFYNETLPVNIDAVKYKALLEVTDWMGK